MSCMSGSPNLNSFREVLIVSRKLFKLGEPDMQDIAGEAEMNS